MASDLEDLSDLRLFALRKSLISPEPQTITNHLVVDSTPNEKCPMHGKNGTFHLPERHSRKDNHRLSVAELDSRRSSSCTEQSTRNSIQLDGFNSMPRRLSKSTNSSHQVNRRGSFNESPNNGHYNSPIHSKPIPRDVFRGRVDFKTILRRFDPKDEERSSGGGSLNASSIHHPNNSRLRRFRHDSESRDGLIIDSDFDFRENIFPREPNYDHPGDFRFRSGSGSNNHTTSTTNNRSSKKNLHLDTDLANKSLAGNSNPLSPRRGCESNPISPRHVEFGQDVVFDFNPSSLPHVVSPSTTMFHKPILRHTHSDSHDAVENNNDLVIHHTNPNVEVEDTDSFVQIFVPQNQEDETESLTTSVDSDDTLEDIEQNPLAIRKLPPSLGDLHRAQSFPPPRTSHDNQSLESNTIRKLSLQEEMLHKSHQYDMVEHENETLRDRVSELEKRLHDQNDEITCLRATLADALRRINTLESGKEHVQISQRDVRPHRNVDHPARRQINMQHEAVGRRASYASNRENHAQSVISRRSVAGIYQSTGSLHSDGHSSTSMSPAPSPSPTQHNNHGHHHHYNSRSSTVPIRGAVNNHLMPPPSTSKTPNGRMKQLSGSMSNLSLSGSRKWNSTSDFRDQSPGPNNVLARRLQAGSMSSLRSPYGSQQNLSERSFKHGTKDAIFNEEEGTVQMFIRGRPVTLFVPTDLMNSYSLNKVLPAPSVKPTLEWVYGYRGRDARSNLHLLPTGEMIYFVAAVVILFNTEEHSQRHYLGHTEEIKCLVIHPNKLLVATGQSAGPDRKDNRSDFYYEDGYYFRRRRRYHKHMAHIRIWNSVSLQTLHVIGLGEFERSVVCLSFSKADGGNILLAIDEGSDHTLSLWDWSRNERGTKITETKCSTETVVAAEFHPLEAGLIVSIGRGHVNFWQLDNTALTLSRKTGIFDQRDKPKYVTCLAFSSIGDVITGDSNGNVFVWGRGYNAVTKVFRKVHEGPIFSICVLKDGSIVTGGGKDRRLVQFDTVYKRTGIEAELPEHLGSVRTISQGKGSQLLLGSTRNTILQGTFDLGFQEIVTGHVDEVWALATHPQQNQFLSAGYDMHIHLWDTLTHRAVWSSTLGDQAQSACFSSTGEIIIVGMSSGKWMALDSQTREVYGVYHDGSEAIQTVRYSPDDRFLALGSRDGIVYVYQVIDKKKFNRIGRCVTEAAKLRRHSTTNPNNTLGHSNFITHLDWSKDGLYLQTNSGDNELAYWNASICRLVPNPAKFRDTEWATQTCIVNFATIGTWPENYDGTDISTCSRSRNGKYLATGDDWGKIKLLANPATQPKSLNHTVGGHGSQVGRLDFLPDDSRFISAGGRDTAIMQWSLA